MMLMSCDSLVKTFEAFESSLKSLDHISLLFAVETSQRLYLEVFFIPKCSFFVWNPTFDIILTEPVSFDMKIWIWEKIDTWKNSKEKSKKHDIERRIAKWCRSAGWYENQNVFSVSLFLCWRRVINMTIEKKMKIFLIKFFFSWGPC